MKLRVLLLLAPLAGLASVPVSRSALAAETPLEEARALTSKATVEYNVGRFQQALELYTKAYERLPKPALLFNIGQCHRLLGHYEQALFFYHGYLREQPEASNHALAEQHIEESQRALDAQRAAQAQQDAQRQASQASAPSPASSPAARPTAGSAPSATSAAASASPETTTPSHVSPAMRIAGLATAGVGVLLVGTGVAFGVHANSLSREVAQVATQHGTWTSQYQSDYDSGKSSATAATVLYIVGGTAIAAGAVLTWFGWPKSQPPVSAGLAPLPGGATLGMSGRF
jgi:tetratricopeptide (TPR) repeat protein